MATNVWTGTVDGNAETALNWTEGLPASGQDIILPPYATRGITSGMDALGARTLKSFWVQEGFTHDIGNTSGGFFQVDISHSGATQFLYEGSSTLAKFQIIKTLAATPINIRKTGIGNAGQPAFQLITNDVSAASTNVGKVSVYSGEVLLGPEQKICEIESLTVGSNSSESSPTVTAGVNCRSTTGDGPLIRLTVNSGHVTAQCLSANVDQHGGEISYEGLLLATLNLYGGTIKFNNPTDASGGYAISKLNLRGGTVSNVENPTVKTFTNADLYSGSIQDPLGKLVWTNAVVFKNKMTDVDFDFGPERTVTIA